MRAPSLVLAGVVSATVLTAAQAPAPQAPVFRAGVDLLTLDVTALDNTGRQVTDLTAADFAVDVDGDRRAVVSAEYVRLTDPRRPALTRVARDQAAAAASVAADDTYFSGNRRPATPGRLVLLLVDQGNIAMGAAMPVMQRAARFVDSLQPEDRVAVAAVPPPGEALDFTTDHDKVREALLRITGLVSAGRMPHNISISEALAINEGSDGRMSGGAIARECEGLAGFDLDRCVRDMVQEAAEMAAVVRTQAGRSLASMRDIFRGLAAVDGPKHVILVSQGLILEHLGSEVDDLASVAADARASIDVLLLDTVPNDVAQAGRPTTPGDDRRRQEEGLDTLAGFARGTVYRITSSPDAAFERIHRALAGYYVLGLESKPSDRDGKRRRIAVSSARKGLTLRTRRSILPTASAGATTPAEAVLAALRSPLPPNDLPFRIASWLFKEPGTSQVRVIVAVEAERLADQPLDYTTALGLIGRDGRMMMPGAAVQTFTTTSAEPGVAVYTTVLVVEPGVYGLRVALADSEGRLGRVDRTVTAFQMGGTDLSLGDLLVGAVPSGSTSLRLPASIEPHIAGGSVAAMMELYGGTQTSAATLTAVLDVLQGELSTPLATMPMQLSTGPSPEITAAQAILPAASLPPGQYFARATVRREGKTVGHLSRPFRVVAGVASTGPTSATGTTAATALSPALVATMTAALPPFQLAEWMTPAVMGPMLAAAEGRGAAARAAVVEARAGRFGEGAMVALLQGDQALAAFLKGLDLLAKGQPAPALAQLQSAMQQAPSFAPARFYLGVALAASDRQSDAAGLLQSGSAGLPPALSLAAGEAWLRGGNADAAIQALERAATRPDADGRTIRALTFAYVLGNRPADALRQLQPYLVQNTTDQAALLVGIYALYTRHAGGPQPATLVADRSLARQWLAAYRATDTSHALATAWVQHLDTLK